MYTEAHNSKCARQATPIASPASSSMHGNHYERKTTRSERSTLQQSRITTKKKSLQLAFLSEVSRYSGTYHTCTSGGTPNACSIQPTAKLSRVRPQPSCPGPPTARAKKSDLFHSMFVAFNPQSSCPGFAHSQAVQGSPP